jgi:hypothetical protein
MPIVLQLDTALFTQILAAEHEGLQSLDAPLAAQCAMTIDHLATYYFTKASKGEPAVRALQGHLQVTVKTVTVKTEIVELTNIGGVVSLVTFIVQRLSVPFG